MYAVCFSVKLTKGLLFRLKYVLMEIALHRLILCVLMFELTTVHNHRYISLKQSADTNDVQSTS